MNSLTHRQLSATAELRMPVQGKKDTDTVRRQQMQRRRSVNISP